MPLTVMLTLLGSVILLISWIIVGLRIQNSESAASVQVKLLHRFLLNMAIFFFIMFLPHIWLAIDYSQFPFYMAWGYIIGHIFLYLSFINIVRLTFSMVPRIAAKEKVAVAAAVLASIGITVVNVITMGFGTQPAYDFDNNITLFNAGTVVGVSIALFAAVTIFPAAILMITNGFRQPSARLRSFMLGGGLLILMTAGPMHDTATTARQYMIADVVSIASLMILTTGILYRYEERLQATKRVRVS